MQGIARKLQAGNQKQPEHLMQKRWPRRGSINDQADIKLKSAETMALVQMISDSGLRRSELAALTWGDIEIQPDGAGGDTRCKVQNRSNWGGRKYRDHSASG